MEACYLAKEQGINTCESCWANCGCWVFEVIDKNGINKPLFKPQPL
jgi:hypothetical protein